LAVSRRIHGRWERVAATVPAATGQTRNLKKGPTRPEQGRLRTGDVGRVEVRASQPGVVTVFNVGAGGDLNVLYPDDPSAPGLEPSLRAGQWLQVVGDVQLVPPTGRERIFAVWTRTPLPVTPEQLRALAGEEPPGHAYQATRNMAKVKRLVQQLPPAERRGTVREGDPLA